MTPNPQLQALTSKFRKTLNPIPQFDLVDSKSTRRLAVESYIANQFQHVYSARITQFLPCLLTMNCGNELSGAVGFSNGSEKALFLEQYLDLPVQKEIQKTLARVVQRQTIVEIGNLVTTTYGASKVLFIVLTSMLYRAGFEQMVFTATRQLLRKLNVLGFESHDLKYADPVCLSSPSSVDWGSYHDNDPKVVTGTLANAMEIIDGRNMFKCIQKIYASRIDILAGRISAQAGVAVD